jgi:hypothetical protein
MDEQSKLAVQLARNDQDLEAIKRDVLRCGLVLHAYLHRVAEGADHLSPSEGRDLMRLTAALASVGYNHVVELLAEQGVAVMVPDPQPRDLPPPENCRG